MSDDQPVQVPLDDVIDIYRSKVARQLGAHLEPELWDGSVAEAMARTVRGRQSAELDDLRRQVDALAASLADDESADDG